MDSGDAERFLRGQKATRSLTDDTRRKKLARPLIFSAIAAASSDSFYRRYHGSRRSVLNGCSRCSFAKTQRDYLHNRNLARGEGRRPVPRRTEIGSAIYPTISGALAASIACAPTRQCGAIFTNSASVCRCHDGLEDEL